MSSCLKFFASIILVFFISSSYANNQLKGFEQKLSDSVITTKIRAKLTKNKNLNPLKISVSTKNGVVILRGHVNNRQAFVEALKQAKNTKGVKAVDIDDLTIKEVNTTFTDAYITAKVEAIILKAKVFDDESIPLVGIKATTVNGTVTLSGNVKQKKSIAIILKRVKSIRGVKHVILKLTVKKSH